MSNHDVRSQTAPNTFSSSARCTYPRKTWLEAIEEVETSPDSDAALSLYMRRKIAERLVWHRVGVLVLSVLALAVFVGAMAYGMGFIPQIGGLADGLAQVAEIGRGLVR